MLEPRVQTLRILLEDSWLRSPSALLGEVGLLPWRGFGDREFL